MHKYLDEAYNDTMRILTENIEVLEAMAQALLEVETINHKQVENLFKYHSIYAPGEEPKQEESEFSPPPMDDGYGLPSLQINLTLKGLGIAQVFLAPLRK